MHQRTSLELVLPRAIIREVASCISPRNGTEILNLALTAKCFYIYVSPFLYHDIEIRSLDRATILIQHLLNHPDVACLVHSLVLRPSYLQKASKQLLEGEQELAFLLKQLAPNLPQLRKFVWDGLEVPESDIWAALRAGCPLLKGIGINLGCKQLDPDSELFQFSNLQSFSLTSEIHGALYLSPHAGGENLPLALWRMLIFRCPRLRSLTLGGGGATSCSRRKLNVSPIISGCWPKLETLSFGYACASGIGDTKSLMKQLFNTFIDKHRNSLKHLSYHKFDDHTYGNGHQHYHKMALISLGDDALSMLNAIQRDRLQNLTLTSRSCCSNDLKFVKEALLSLPKLKIFGIWVDLSSIETHAEKEENKQGIYDQLREMYESCPIRLEHLKLMLSTNQKETINWRDIHLILRRKNTSFLPFAGRCQLKHFEVWNDVKFGSDRIAKEAALRIALDEVHLGLDSAAGRNHNHNHNTHVDLNAPLLEKIVFVRWTNPELCISQHLSYQVRRQYIDRNNNAREHFGLVPLNKLAPLSAISNNFNQEFNMLPRAFGRLAPVLKLARKAKSWVWSQTTSVTPEVVVNIKAEERVVKDDQTHPKRYEIQLAPVSSIHERMVLHGKSLRFDDYVVTGGHKRFKKAGAGRMWGVLNSNESPRRK
ncbi:hypothetical protein F5890DRAFT_1499770 [Lentinula detonsa]|uniref:Uncharacterized protein n=1 Tax=Lentinula detonsa TaxID=2804962 RepID=A0AA38Q5T3_9AGAR|nr:hypothetical protein F5890DRAFT_1499770 [Lentinula detonsa]